MSKSVFVYSPDCLKYDFSRSHVFRPERAYKVFRVLLETGFFGERLKLVEPRPASKEELLLFHTERYIEALQKEDKAALLEHGVGFGDNPFFKGIFEASALVAGASIKAAEELIQGCEIAFSYAGGLHHAHPDYAYGFCVVNDAVLAIKKIIQSGYDRAGSVLYVDIDAHFGDGVVYGFYESSEVVTISVHESGRYLFPGTGFARETGKGPGEGLKINFPLPPYSAEREFILFVDEVFVPALYSARPSFVVVQAGTDGYREDPLTHLKYSPYCYFYFFSKLKEVQKELNFKILVLGGGGYVPDFASLIWLSSCLYLSEILDFKETSNLLSKEAFSFKLSYKVNFDPENTSVKEIYVEGFSKNLEAAKSLVEGLESRLKSSGL